MFYSPVSPRTVGTSPPPLVVCTNLSPLGVLSCTACHQPIITRCFVKCKRSVYHRDCFRCGGCGLYLSKHCRIVHDNAQGRPYHPSCFRCSYCNTRITGKKHYHPAWPDLHICAVCRNTLKTCCACEKRCVDDVLALSNNAFKDPSSNVVNNAPGFQGLVRLCNNCFSLKCVQTQAQANQVLDKVLRFFKDQAGMEFTETMQRHQQMYLHSQNKWRPPIPSSAVLSSCATLVENKMEKSSWGRDNHCGKERKDINNCYQSSILSTNYQEVKYLGVAETPHVDHDDYSYPVQDYGYSYSSYTGISTGNVWVVDNRFNLNRQHSKKLGNSFDGSGQRPPSIPVGSYTNQKIIKNTAKGRELTPRESVLRATSFQRGSSLIRVTPPQPRCRHIPVSLQPPLTIYDRTTGMKGCAFRNQPPASLRKYQKGQLRTGNPNVVMQPKVMQPKVMDVTSRPGRSQRSSQGLIMLSGLVADSNKEGLKAHHGVSNNYNGAVEILEQDDLPQKGFFVPFQAVPLWVLNCRHTGKKQTFYGRCECREIDSGVEDEMGTCFAQAALSSSSYPPTFVCPGFSAREREDPVDFLLSPVDSRVRVVKRICVVLGVPEILFASFLAHELTHAFLWLSMPRGVRLSKTDEEGLCGVASSIVLEHHLRVVGGGGGVKKTGDEGKNSQFRLEQQLCQFRLNKLLTSEDKEYGDGYRKLKKIVNGRRLGDAIWDIVEDAKQKLECRKVLLFSPVRTYYADSP